MLPRPAFRGTFDGWPHHDGRVRRISFFVSGTRSSERGLSVRGEPGLGPICPGDAFTAVLHAPTGPEEQVDLVVLQVCEAEVVVKSDVPVKLLEGDILTGECE